MIKSFRLNGVLMRKHFIDNMELIQHSAPIPKDIQFLMKTIMILRRGSIN